MVDIKVKELTYNDCICPICMSIQVEPVTLPCSHEFCMPCFRSSLELSNMTCPMCRVRISTWSRRAKRSNTLINRKKWAQIQLLFPDKIKQRLNQQEDVDEVDGDIPFGQQPNKNIAKPGEIRQEYEDELRRLRDERNRRDLEEMKASEELIKKLARDESTSVDFWKKQQEIIEKDTFYAQALEKNPNLNLKNLMDSPRTTRSASCSALPQSTPSLLEKYLIKQKKKQKLDDIKRSRSAAEVLDSPRKEIDASDREASTTSNSSSSTISVIVQGNPNNQSSAASTATLTSIQNNRCSTIRQLFKAELERGVKPANASENSPAVNASTSSQKATKGTIRQYLMSGDSLNVAGSSAGEAKEKIPSSRSRSRSTESNDSISREINHFKPIHACMKTPPKRLPGGKFYEPKVVHSTPVNPSRPDLKTPPAHIDGVGSPVMQRMLSNLASERRNSIEKYSKSTSTDGNELLVKQSDGRRRMKHSAISKMKRWSRSLNESLTDDDEEDRGYECNRRISKKSKKGDEILLNDSKKTLIGEKGPNENFDIFDTKTSKYSIKYDCDAHISNNNCEKDDHNEFSPSGTSILDNWLNSRNGSPDVFKNGAKSVIIKNENGRSNSSRSNVKRNAAKDGKITAKSAPKRHSVVKNSKKLKSSKLSRKLNTLGVKQSHRGQLLTNTFGFQDDCEAEDDSSNDSKKLYIHMSDDSLSADNSDSSSTLNYVPHVVTLNKKTQRKNNNNKTSKKEKKTRASNVDDDDGEVVDDHKLALRLQKSFDIEAKINASFTRHTEDYNLRRSTRRNKLV